MTNETVFLGALGSGSSGNAYVIEYQDEALIIDQGFSRRELLKRMECSGFVPEKLCGALLTHEHSDHCKGSRVFCDALSLPLYTTAKTARYLSTHGTLPRHVCAFEAGEEFDLGNFKIKSFSLPHDAVDPVGFQISCGNVRIGIATDFGHAPENIRRELRNCNALVLESNYDREMLLNSDRRLELKRRILGVRGHLGNCESCQLLPDLIGEQTQLLLLAHISSECNTPELVRENCLSMLQLLDIEEKLHFEILSQDQPSSKFEITGGGQ
ncbi:MAG: MBL fold metallo-hydrolase [Lentisphaerae bacterium]|nr:MBL fold metallo-hydrolase [Lentisphaerota bacterium]